MEELHHARYAQEAILLCLQKVLGLMHCCFSPLLKLLQVYSRLNTLHLLQTQWVPLSMLCTKLSKAMLAVMQNCKLRNMPRLLHQEHCS